MSIDKYFGNRAFKVSMLSGLSFTGNAEIEISGNFPQIHFTSWNGAKYSKYFDETGGREDKAFTEVVVDLHRELLRFTLRGSHNYYSERFEWPTRTNGIFSQARHPA